MNAVGIQPKPIGKPLDNRVVVIALIFLICVVLLGFTFYSINITYQINDEISEKAKIASELKSQRDELLSIKEKDAQMELVVRQAHVKIPALPDEAGIIEFVKSNAGGSLTGINFGQRENLGFAVEMPFTITAIGSYGDMLDLLFALAFSERFYTVESVNIDKTADGEISYIIHASAYYNFTAKNTGL
ncbi:MAG TPA: type 4a pilus biogenesis protein PilO [Clostridiales bacterium]|nr:type 4a pilus biogenesis protein PilO [Clostridiales bacterium]